MSSLVGLTFWVDIPVKLEIKASNCRIMFPEWQAKARRQSKVWESPVHGIRMMFPDLPKGFRDDLPGKQGLKNQVPGPWPVALHES